MRKYLFGTGIISAFTTGMALLREVRGNETFTWRMALAWLSWGITVALAVGAITDIFRASRGALVAEDSPVHGNETKLYKRRLKHQI